MQATSRESAKALRERFDELTGSSSGADVPALRTLGDELAAVVVVLEDNHELARHLADPGAAEAARTGLADRLFGGKVGDTTLEVVRTAAAHRWSRTGDLVDSFETLARQALLAAAEREDLLDETEDELFRFGRLLGTESRLRELLSDQRVPAQQRLELLNGLLEGKAGRPTVDLLDQAVRTTRGRGLDVVVEQLAELAAARRERSVALVTAAAPLSQQQEERLAQVLTRIYGRTMSVQVDVDPEVLGGLVVRVGDEVIDGTIAAKLAKAGQGLPS
ncbi:MAG TPA: F0F1 ATP synthase subunit delta [Amycolatopsis sp.]|nr:F0F1 ATP synthase subunit delta [Amycolatopsis sp.]